MGRTAVSLFWIPYELNLFNEIKTERDRRQRRIRNKVRRNIHDICLFNYSKKLTNIELYVDDIVRIFRGKG